jgi:hypothetical protein
VVEGATHSVLNMNAIGLAEEFAQERNGTEDFERTINRKDLSESAVKFILKNIKS